MRINQEMLIKIAKDHVAQRERKEKDLIAVYLTGSVTEGEPLLGGTTDIDMVFVHKEEPSVKREVIRVTYEISLDIEHHHQSYYTYHRRLRKNPWFGHHLCKHQNILLDKDHWLEFLHASVSSGFDKPENVYARAEQFSVKAREQWFDLDDPQEVPWGEWIALYFQSVGTAANAIACLEGPVLTIRRFISEFSRRVELMDQLALIGELSRLLGNQEFDQEKFEKWRPVWESALEKANQQADCPANIKKVRKAYFLQSVDVLAENNALHAVLWPMLETWQQAVSVLEEDQEALKNWFEFLRELNFERDQKERLLKDLDHFIDQGEHILEDYKNEFNL